MKNKFLQFLSSMRRGAAMLLLLVTCVTHAWATWWVLGDNLTDGWTQTNNNKMLTSGSNSYVYLSLTSGTTYYFKIYNGSWDGGNTRCNNGTATISLDTDYQTYDNNGANDKKMEFTPSATGVYKFNLNSSNVLRITQVKPTAAAPSNVVSGTNIMFYIKGQYAGWNYLVNSSKSQASTSYPLSEAGYSYVNTAKSNVTTYDRITNNPSGWNGDQNTTIHDAKGGELFDWNSTYNVAAKTASTTWEVSDDELSISTTCNSATGVWMSNPLYIQYYIDGSFVGVTYSSSTASYASIPAATTARASTYDVSSLTNGSHTLKTVLTDGIIYYVADQDNFNVAHTYSVTLDEDGPYQGNGSASVKYGDKALTISSHASRTGWSIEGYYAAGTGDKVTDANGNLLESKSFSDGSSHAITNSSSEWIYDGDLTLYAHWKQTYSVTYYANYPASATSTSGSVPTDATEYNSGATVTVKYNSGSLAAGGYTFAGWNTQEDGNGTNYTAGSGTFSISANTPLYAKWTENKTTVTVNVSPSGSGTLTVDASSFASGNTTTAGVGTSRTVVATAQPGYKFSSWSATGNATGTSSTNTYTLKGNGSGSTATLTASFDRTYAFVEGRFQVYDAARNTRTNTSLDNGGWNDSQCYIPFSYDNTNHRFELHTYSTPKELSDIIFNNAPVFYVKLSTASGSLSNVVSYWSATSQTLSAASTKKTLTHTGDLVNYNLKFSSSDESGYAILYFDEAGIWYELEQRLQYNGNGNTGGSAPSNNGNYFAKGTKAAAGTNAYTKTGYHFTGWKINNAGDLISAGSNVTMNSNITLYAQWEADTYENVTIDDNGGSANGAYSVTYFNTSLTVTTTPTKTGYEPEGYYKEVGTTTKVANTDGSLIANRTYTDGSSRWIATNRPTLYTKWQANTYTADNNIDGNGGSAGKYTATYDATGIAINTAPTRTGYNLTGYHAWGREANTLANTAGALSANQSENKDGGKTLTNSGSQWIYDGTDATIYADWSPKTYSISLDQEGGASGSTSVTMTYDASTHTAITNPSKTGYTFAGYWTGDNGTGSMVIATDGTLQANVDTYTGDGGIWKKDATCTLYAKWTPNEYAVTLSTTGETGYGSGAPDNQTATYGAAMPTITPPVGAAGYKFQGYFTAANGAGTQYYNANGTSAHEWDIASSASTLHAYFQKAEITALEHASSVAKGETTYLVVNPTMNLVPEGYSAICWTLHYAENDNPVSEESWSVDSYTEGGTKQKQVRFTFTNLAVGSYYVKAVLKANASSFDPCSVGTELDTETGNFSVIGSSTVTIKYQYFGTGDVIAASGSVEISAAGNSDITAPDIIGYSFREWSLGAGVTKNSGSLTDATINISSTYDGVVTAFYNKKQMIYFNNTLGWDTVYVYFYNNGNYWGNNDQGTGANTKDFSGAYTGKHGGMSKIAGTNIYYFDLTANSVSTSLTNVAFTEKDQPGYGFFSANNVIGRGDYSAALSMYVPLAGVDPVTKNGTGEHMSYYYEKGYWMNYPDNSGYTLKIYDNTTDGGLRKSIQFPFAADMKMPMAITTDLEGGKTYGFQLYRIDGTTYGNSGTMTNGHSGDEGQGVWEFKSDVANKAGLTTTSAGDYTFTLTYGMDLSSNYNYLIGVRYPESTGDFRVQYKDNENSTWKTSVVIPKLTEADTVSYFVRRSQSPYIRIQKCTATYDAGTSTTTVTWDDVNEGANILPDTISANGVYNFIFTKAGDNLVLSEVEPYTGNFYIRVDGAGSTNWDSYRAADHIMPFSEYSFSQEENAYSHYFTKWYDTSGGAKNIKFVVANDYSTNISDTIVKDGIADNYVDVNGWLSGRSANIRFMYNYKTNEASRRYIDGAQGPGSDDFLKIICEHDNQISIRNYDDTADSLVSEVKFTDNGNWIYEANVKAKPGSTYKLRSSFGVYPNVVYQYFKGAASGEEGEYEELIGGDPSGSSLQIRLLYDFKTNRLVAAYVPSGMIDENLVINADIMFVREHQGNVTQITFAEDKSISAIENVYSTLRFNKSTINDPSLSRYERDLFYVSFPYDVQLSDVIGFGDYGKHWIIEYYDGAGRAEKGFWADSESFWKFVTPAMKNSFKLKAGTGYIVALDLDEMGNSSSIWDNTSTVELIFPGDISAICDQEVTYTMPQHQCNIGPRFEGGDDRRFKDSHWNVLGVPTYHNTTGTFENHTDEIGGKSQVWSTDGKPNFLYTWNMTDNSLSVTSASGYNYKAMHAYIVQYYGDVTFHTSTNAAPSPIVARRTYAEEPIDVNFRLELSKNGVVEDQTFVSMTNDEEASVNFVFGEDLSKEFNKNKANIYTMVTTQMADGPSITETAGNTLPMTNQTTIVPVGVKIAADGEYTFSIPEGTYGVGITLIDNEAGARVNLGLMDYTVTLAAGQIDDRFVLEISPISQISTDVEAVTGDGLQVTGARKIMIDGLLYIVKDGVVYDAQGHRL